jgi:hypothetical protein
MKLRQVVATISWETASPYVRALVAASLANDMFVDGQPEVAITSYEMATAELPGIGHPLDFLEAFIAIEYVNRTYVQYLGE